MINMGTAGKSRENKNGFCSMQFVVKTVRKSIAAVLPLLVLFCVALLSYYAAGDRDYRAFARALAKNGGVRAVYAVKSTDDENFTASQLEEIREQLDKSLADKGYESFYVSLDGSKYIVVEIAWTEGLDLDRRVVYADLNGGI